MSSRSTIFLTNDNEHCYEECCSPILDENKKWIGNEIELELNKENIRFSQHDWGINIVFTNPNSEIYKKIKSLQE